MPRINAYRSLSFVIALALMAGLLTVLSVSPVAAATADLTATLSGDQEVPAVETAATGSASVAIDTEAASGEQLCYDVTSTGLEGGAVIGAHIHEGAAGANGPVVVTLVAVTEGDGTGAACAADADFDLAAAENDDIAAFLADLAANPANYYINVHTEANDGGEIRGQLAAAGDGGATATIMVMKHNCANVTTMAEFEEVEARAATNPTTPDAAFGPTVETVLECPTVVLPGDEQTSDTVAGGESTFEFTVADGTGTATLSTDGAFVATAACETGVEYDADRSGELDDNVCLDLSHYEFDVSTDGQITVTETAPPSGLTFGALRFTPGSGDDASLVSADGGVIVLDASADEDGMIMLHVYNFAVASAVEPTPVASELPDAAVSPAGAPGSTSVALLFGIMALVSIGFAGVRTVATRRNR